MSLVRVRYRKWPGRLHWHFELEQFAEDEHGVWLGGPPGLVIQRGDEPPRTMEHATVQLIAPGRWWTPFWNAGGEYAIYVDVITPAEWDGKLVTFADLDLDVIRTFDGEVALLDEDEFLDHQQRYGYPPHVIDAARSAAACMVLDLEQRNEPFGAVGEARMAEWLAQLGED